LAVSDLVRDVKNTDPSLRDLSMPDVRVVSFEEGSFDIQSSSLRVLVMLGSRSGALRRARM
jgi:hypothetical protein